LYKQGNRSIFIKAFAFLDNFIKKYPEPYLERDASVSFKKEDILEELNQVILLDIGTTILKDLEKEIITKI